MMLPLDDRDGWIWFDGSLIPWHEAKLHVLSHGLHYASAVFEGERAYDGRIVALREHGDRLLRSCELVELACPFGARELDSAAEQVVAANGLREAYIRRIVWRGSGVLAVGAPDNPVHVAIAAWPWTGAEGHARRMLGVRLNVATWRRPPPETMPHQAKLSAAYAIGTLSRHAATRAGFDDALMLDWRGRVAEASGANIFFVEGDRLVTPVPDCFLDGITRRRVITLAMERGTEVVERAVTPDEMARFDDAFLVGTAAEVTPVREIDGRQFRAGATTTAMIDAYHRFVRSPAPLAAAA
jgi:branched-chain amino acid aminotransferase